MEDKPLRPATPDELIETLIHALQFDGRKAHRHANGFMARVAAEVLVKHLERTGFVVMKKPPAPNHTMETWYKGDG